MSVSARRSAWLATVTTTCPVLPSLRRGSRGRLTSPLPLTETTVEVTVKSCHMIGPLPAPSVSQTRPSAALKVTTRGFFCPGATPWDLARRTSMEVAGSVATFIRIPILIFKLVHPASTIAAAKATIADVLEIRETATDVFHLLIVGHRPFWGNAGLYFLDVISRAKSRNNSSQAEV